MKTADTPLARQVRAIMESGGYVSDEITNEIVKDRLAQSDCAAGFLLDGNPRTLQQVETLDNYLAETGRPLEEASERVFAALEAHREGKASELIKP